MNLDDAQTLAELLMEQHGLFKRLLPWSFKFDQSVRRFGACKYAQRLITLSWRLVRANDESHVEDTILHEIAHALAGSRAGHSREWKRVAVSIGCTGARLYGSEVIRPKRKWLGTCPNGHTTQSHRRGNLACKRCCKEFNGNQFTTAYLFTWSENQ